MRVHQETEKERYGRFLLCGDLSRNTTPPPGTENIVITVRRLKAKMFRLTSQYMRGVLLDTTDNDCMQGEDITTYHYICSRKRQKTRQVTHIIDDQGHLQTDHDVIMRQFTDFLETKYSLLPIDTRSFQTMVSCEMPKIPEDANTVLDNPITLEEVREAVKKGKRHKSPGPDGICHEFFIKKWDIVKDDLTDIINIMHMEGSVSDSQKTRTHCMPTQTSHSNEPGNL